MTFGLRLRALRESTGLTITEVAKRIGLKLITVSQWERYLGAAPGPDRIKKLCEALDCPEHESELLELAHRERGKIAVALAGQDDSTISMLTELERLCRDGKLTAKKAKEIHELLAD